MKTRLIAALAPAATMILTSAAQANVTLNFGGPYTFTGGQGTTLTTAPLIGTLTGIAVTLDYSNAVGASWVADTGVVVDNLQWGGYDMYILGATTYMGPIAGFPNNGNPGTYNGTGGGANVVYNNTSAVVGFGNAWSASGGATFNNVVITLIGVDLVPAPGALALLGLAGVVGTRRRRA